MDIYSSILGKCREHKKQLAVLVDPDKLGVPEIGRLADIASKAQADYFFVGGSLLINNQMDQSVKALKENSHIPVVLFPGNTMQLSWKADAILFLSLISGRNAEMLIGRHVISAPYIRISPLEVISCGYILVESGKQTAVQYMSNTSPIPADKNDIAICTAMAGEMLGLKMIYLEAGSGASQAVPPEMIRQVKECLTIPLIVGGGIRTPEQAGLACRNGADLIVIGSAFEKDPNLIVSMAEAIHNS